MQRLPRAGLLPLPQADVAVSTPDMITILTQNRTWQKMSSRRFALSVRDCHNVAIATTVSSPPTLHVPGPGHQQAYDRRWWMLVVLCLSLLIVFVGNSSLNVALPSLSRDFGATEAQLQWVVASYSLVFAGLLFTTGALGDRFGRKGALQFGLATFFVGAAAASQATEMWQIIGCRALMGVGAAFIMPSTLSILVNVFPAGERAKAIAIWAATTGVAGSMGPLISGFLLTHFWFGSVFLINLPIIAVAFVSGWFLIPKSKDPEQGRLDPPGAILSIIGISSLVFGLIQAPDKGWAAPQTLIAFGIAFVMLTLFVLWELHTDEPMLDIRFFRNRSFSTGSGGMMLVFLAMYGVMFLMTQYFQLVLGYSPLSAALRMLPMAPIMIIVAPSTPWLSARFGANRVVGVGHAARSRPGSCCSRRSVCTPGTGSSWPRSFRSRRAWRCRCRR